MENKKEILVSVVILTYNQEKFIAKAIEGALMQKRNFIMEILIADDCSSDATPSICKDYAIHYPDIIRFISNKSNKGIIDNYFDTLLQVKGKYIADCAGDDYWDDPEKLQRQVNILERENNIVLTYTNFKIYYENTGKWLYDVYGVNHFFKPTYATYSDYIYELLNQDKAPFVFLGSSCFRTKSFKNVYNRYTSYFRNKQYPCEDYQLIFFLFMEGDFYYENQQTTVYRILESTSNSENISKQLEFIYKTYLLRTDLIHDFQFDVSQCNSFFYTRLKAILSMSMLLHRNEYGKSAVKIANSLGYTFPFRLRIYAFLNQYSFLSYIFILLKKYRKYLYNNMEK